MVDRGVMLGHVISQIRAASSPVSSELALIGSVSKPMKPHVHCFEFFQYIILYDTERCGVVDLDRAGRLGMAHFLQ